MTMDVRGFDNERYKHDWAFSLYLVSLSAVITATVGVFLASASYCSPLQTPPRRLQDRSLRH
jgi:hypothetical protein